MFLHGLSSVTPSEKTKYLDETFTLFAPQIDYEKENIFDEVLQLAEKYKPAIIIGSSIGGYLGYYIAAKLKIPCLLFNPALPYRTSINPIVKEYETFDRNVYTVLGKLDTTINPTDTLNWLSEQENISDLTIRLLEFAHRIPINIFKNEVERYYRQLNDK